MISDPEVHEWLLSMKFQTAIKGNSRSGKQYILKVNRKRLTVYPYTAKHLLTHCRVTVQDFDIIWAPTIFNRLNVPYADVPATVMLALSKIHST